MKIFSKEMVVNYFMVTYDLYTPGQKYNDLIAEIQRSPKWCKVLLSAFIIGQMKHQIRLASG